MKQIALCTVLLLKGAVAYAAGADEPNAFAQPSQRYLLQFAKPGEKVFVYERYDAKGALFQRDAATLISPVKVPSATERVINGVTYRLRGLAACPKPKITYKTQEWNCTKAAQDYEEGIYNNRASVVLCKTLVLQSRKGGPDAVSCFSLVGAGNTNDPYNVAFDDDEMVFFGMAAIGRTKDGKSLRPDLEHSAELGGQLQE
ncbi:hypothetical protein MesoLj131b_72160 (plasmid) [Mesorhizobium sp. 131-2-5]|uniref:hypothetical protein n=1 Tax=Mesorhizobium sp. 131-2-5 TaxID=2744519 RepID=UPI0018EA993F|nr:hypothetical protein [Mesorhizobium sp. 131-2-5]BCH05217.1 hypothetical protein MesoLj131b_72160 [Mesorhizobium sp. 131-2-5]